MDLRRYRLKRQNDELFAQVTWLRAENERLHNVKFGKQRRFTGWWVLVKKVGEQWFPVCCVNEEDERWEEEDLPECTQMVPIAHPDDVEEWDGF